MPAPRALFALCAMTLVGLPVTLPAQDAGLTSPAVPSEQAAPPLAPSPHLVGNGNLISTLKGSGHFTVLIKALDAAQLTPVLASTPDLTLFAPTDDAFQALPAGQLTALLSPQNAALLQRILTYHLVHLNLDSAKFKGAKGPVESVEKGKLQIDGSGAGLKVNDANVIQADVHATNGTIQVVDRVLLPAGVTLPSASVEIGSSPTSGR